MKLYNNTNYQCHRISLLSKHLSPPSHTKKTRSSLSKKKLSNSSYLSSNQKKSRYHFLKSSKNKHQIHLRQEHKTLANEQRLSYLTKLRQEAYADLHATLQNYNDEFVKSMRYMEESNLFSVPSSDSLASSSSTSSSEEEQDDISLSMQNLVDLFEAGTIKDYSQLIEWESFTNPPNYFECQGEYGDLW